MFSGWQQRREILISIDHRCFKLIAQLKWVMFKLLMHGCYSLTKKKHAACGLYQAILRNIRNSVIHCSNFLQIALSIICCSNDDSSSIFMPSVVIFLFVFLKMDSPSSSGFFLTTYHVCFLLDNSVPCLLSSG